jgi:hypothetical protein
MMHLWLVTKIKSGVLKLFPLTQQLKPYARHNQLSKAIDLTCSFLFYQLYKSFGFCMWMKHTFNLSTFSTNYGYKVKIANKQFDAWYKLDMDVQWWRDKLSNISKASFLFHSLHTCYVLSFLDLWTNFGFAKPRQRVVVWGPKDCECN